MSEEFASNSFLAVAVGGLMLLWLYRSRNSLSLQVRVLASHRGKRPDARHFRTTRVGLPNQTASCKPSARPNRIYLNFVAENAPADDLTAPRPDAQ
jgi:hypothetical protein